jgi:HAD superfamily hydrolase (TIGR01458 family)
VVSGVLLDLSGVLYDGERAIPGSVDAVGRLRENSLPVRFLTNSTRRPKRVIVEKLLAMGFDVDASEILTPAEAACDWLKKEGFAPHLLVHPDLEEDFIDVPDSDCHAVIVGDAGQYFSYDRMNAAFRKLAQGAPFLALAANRVFQDTDGELSLDAGAFVHALEFSSGTAPILLGKPSPGFFMAGVRSMGCEPEEVIMIGDDAESDVAGALQAGIGQGILVRTGKYRRDDEARYRPRPSAVSADILEAVEGLVGEHR